MHLSHRRRVGSIMRAIVGTAGWSIARKDAAAFPPDGTALERYAQLLNGVEVNSSFYRSHRLDTWARWAASVPSGFRFAVKLPKTITHQARLVDAEAGIARFADEIARLGDKLGLLLAQLPPKLDFDCAVAERFISLLREAIDVPIVCEPRHPSWFEDDANRLLDRLRVARAAADPALCPAAAAPGGWRGILYWRLHGSPAMYRSAYSDEALDGYAHDIAAAAGGADAWCIFDNTAASAATGNALSLKARLADRPRMV